jgi:hypothetical protein
VTEAYDDSSLELGSVNHDMSYEAKSIFSFPASICAAADESSVDELRETEAELDDGAAWPY